MIASARKPHQPTAGVGSEATPPCLIIWSSNAPAQIHTTKARTDAVSMANSLPTNIASMRIAAAITSMILFDFSSISCDITMVESISVRKKSPAWAIHAVVARSAANEPVETCTSVTAKSVSSAESPSRASAIRSLSWATVAGSLPSAPTSLG